MREVKEINRGMDNSDTDEKQNNDKNKQTG